MEPEIVNLGQFDIIGVEMKTITRDGRNFIEIPLFWEKILQEGLIETIPGCKQPGTMLGICLDFNPDNSFTYIIGCDVMRCEKPPENMVCRSIPSAHYAVFTAIGKMPQTIQSMVKHIYNEWLPNSDYQRVDAADFELYDERCQDADNPAVDIYFPIVPV
ncbi:MAG: AraC family transcriptional regulator [Candidatus Delongbacteria bacterium]|nr:AraC family transcriptional regulator [bacterium]MBL7032836.1 AraC family transcriptional regulator [Candidatus Delongbacteria bacterium]